LKTWINSLKHSPNIVVYLNATCLRLNTNHDGSSVESLKAASLERNEFLVRAKQYVLATGGLETPRILLLSNDIHPGGLGNGSDLVGRFYMSHLHGRVGEVRIIPGDRPTTLDLEITPERVFCRRMISIDGAKQRDCKLLNLSAFLSHPLTSAPGHKNGVLSARYLKELWFPRIALKKGIRAKTIANQTEARHVRAHVSNIVLDAPRLLWYSKNWMLNSIWGRKNYLPLRMKAHADAFILTVDSEQAPNPDSRVTLGDKKDIFGLRRLKIDWRVTDLDMQSVLKSCNLIARELDQSNVGRLRFDPRVITSTLVTRAMGGHHIGTTRMASEPSGGVVNVNCRVHGVNNLHIASSSVFPTSGSANPTLTLIADLNSSDDSLSMSFKGSHWE